MTRDEYIQTEVMQKCWHEILPYAAETGFVCDKCKRKDIPAIESLMRPNFSTSPDAYELQQFVLRAEWWLDFELFVWAKWRKPKNQPMPDAGYIKWLFSDASRFADLVATYKGWEVDK